MSENPPKWNPIIAFKTCMKRYAQFSGRASRSEYWYYALALFILYFVGILIDVFLFMGFPLCELVISLGTLVPNLAVAWRRMHDSDLHGAQCLWGLVPWVGGIIVIILACRASSAGPNRFGDAPAAPEA